MPKLIRVIFWCITGYAVLPLCLAESINVSGKVVLLQNWEGHSGTLVRLEDRLLTVGVCTRNDWYILPKTHQYAEENFAMLLAARMSEKAVTVRVKADECVEGFPRIIHLDL